MRTEKYVHDLHYPLVFHWWRAQNGRVFDPSQISDDGVVVFSTDERPLCASWLYHGNSKLAHIGFTVANPSSGPKEKIYAVTLAIEYLKARAKEVGMRFIASNSDSSALTKLFSRAGFDIMEPHTSLLFRIENYGNKEIL